MKALLKQKISESVSSVLPITVIVLLLSFTNLAPMPAGMLLLFILGAVMLIVGMGFFQLGAEIAMTISSIEPTRNINTLPRSIGTKNMLMKSTIPVIGKTAARDSSVFSFNFGLI